MTDSIEKSLTNLPDDEKYGLLGASILTTAFFQIACHIGHLAYGGVRAERELFGREQMTDTEGGEAKIIENCIRFTDKKIGAFVGRLVQSPEFLSEREELRTIFQQRVQAAMFTVGKSVSAQGWSEDVLPLVRKTFERLGANNLVQFMNNELQPAPARH